MAELPSLRQLEYFVAVAELGSFSKAAVILNIAQPALSRQVRLLETDLQLARNPGNPFPVYQTLKKADRFGRTELLRALEALAEADARLKSSALNPRLILERVVWQICSPNT